MVKSVFRCHHEKICKLERNMRNCNRKSGTNSSNHFFKIWSEYRINCRSSVFHLTFHSLKPKKNVVKISVLLSLFHFYFETQVERKNEVANWEKGNWYLLIKKKRKIISKRSSSLNPQKSFESHLGNQTHNHLYWPVRRFNPSKHRVLDGEGSLKIRTCTR